MTLPNFFDLGYVQRLIRGATVNEPTSDQKAALVGTSSEPPSATNRFVTELDPRIQNGVTQSGSVVAGHLAVFDADKVIKDGGPVPSGSSSTPVQGEQFAGDGVTVAFVLAHAPSPATVAVYQNGVRQTLTTAYALSGSTVTFTSAPALADEILIDYFY